MSHHKLNREIALTARALAGIACLSTIVAPLSFSDCTCHHPEKGETTHWGGNQTVIIVESKSYQRLQGTIQMADGRTIENALVEIFDKPEYLLANEGKSDQPQKRLALCKTSADGKFCFRALPSGKYELRSSVSHGWNVTKVYVVIDKKAGSRNGITVGMNLGT